MQHDYISKSGLDNLRYYKYSGTDKSLLANYIMQPFWRWLINFFPLFLAPNLITLLGFGAIISMFLTTVNFYEDHVLPQWVLLFNAGCIFCYQTMDALDGKQARRTETSSPLGELFDHGCDAVTTVLLGVVINCALGLEFDVLFFFSVWLSMTAFYSAQWEYYFTGSLDLGYINVTEAQWISIAVNIIPALLGNDFYLRTIEVAGVTLQYNHIVLIPFALGIISSVLQNIISIASFVNNHPSRTFFSSFSLLIPGITVATGYAAWGYNSYYLLEQHPYLFSASYGFAMAILVGKIVLAKVTDMPFYSWHVIMTPLVPCLLVSFLPEFPFNETSTLTFYMIFGVLSYLHLAYNIIRQMTTHLGIKCFLIPTPSGYKNSVYEILLTLSRAEKILKKKSQ